MAITPEERAAQMQLRDVGAPTVWVWLVDPDGYPKRVPTGKNITNGYTEVDGSGHTRLLGAHEDRGWKLMQRVVSPAAWKVWTEYHRQSDAVRGAIKPLPDELWPEGIKRPGVRNSTAKKHEFVPGAPAPAPDPRVHEGAPAEPGATTRGSIRRG